MKRIAIFGSGAGTNAEKIMTHFANHDKINIALVLSNKIDPGILEHARKKGITAISFGQKEMVETNYMLDLLKEHKIDFIVLAGFMKLIPEKIINAYPNKIINIHPALLPSFGGKNMYGSKVHEAVITSGSIISGMTVHYVNEKFDDGEIIFQAACHVSKNDTPETLAAKIHLLEHMYYPVVIEKIVN